MRRHSVSVAAGAKQSGSSIGLGVGPKNGPVEGVLQDESPNTNSHEEDGAFDFDDLGAGDAVVQHLTDYIVDEKLPKTMNDKLQNLES